MREIKFKAWNVYENNWSKIDQTTPIGILNSELYRISQYSGLKDKNGKDIYEGDILPCTDKGNGKVIYEGGLGAFCVAYPNFKQLLMDYKVEYYEGFEVTGNIYENPELVGG